MGPVYVYGVVRSGALDSVGAEGVGGGPVQLIEADGLAALTTPLPEDGLRMRRDDPRRHLRVLEEAFARATVVPCPFGSVVQSQEAVEHYVLGGQRDEIVALLGRLDGRVQMNVKVSYDEERILREIVASDSEIALLRERTRTAGAVAHADSIRLGELTAAAVAERAERDADSAYNRLLRHAEDSVVEESDGMLVLKASFLLPRERIERFNAELDALAASEGPRLRFESFGPLPPTAFASLGTET